MAWTGTIELVNPPGSQTDATAVLIPVKSFELAKERLSEKLDPSQRSELARTMATGVVAAAGPLPVFVVCGTAEVASWAIGVGAGVLWHEHPGLNRSVATATKLLAADGYRSVIIAHGDLPLARSLEWVGDFHGVTIVPDRRGDGTNVMSVPLGSAFDFHYGKGSSALHQAEAEQRGLPVRVVPDDALGLDVDTPSDLAELETRSKRES